MHWNTLPLFHAEQEPGELTIAKIGGHKYVYLNSDCILNLYHEILAQNTERAQLSWNRMQN